MSHLSFFWIGSLLMVPGCALLPYPLDQWEYPSPFEEAKVERATQPACYTVDQFRHHSGKLEGQVIEVSGTIRKVYNKGGCAAATLHGDVLCVFGRKQKRMVSQLRIGERVTFRGIVRPAYNRPRMSPCVRVDENAKVAAS